MRLPTVEMNVFEAILARHSVRRYTGQAIDSATVHTLLEAAVRAPTAIHEEPWEFLIIQDKQLLLRVSDLSKPLFVAEVQRAGLESSSHDLDAFTSPDFNIFYDAGTLIVICAKPKGSFVSADCWLAAENLMLAACAMGLGTCVIGAALPALTTPEVKAELGIPAEIAPIAPVIVGIPSGETAAIPRKKPVVLAWK